MKNIFYLAILIGIIAIIVIPFNGVQYCERNFKKNNPTLANNSVVFNNLWSRSLDNHWVSALVLQPKDIAEPDFTVICHFKSTNYVFDRIEIHQGNKTDRIKRVSMSISDPRTWFK